MNLNYSEHPPNQGEKSSKRLGGNIATTTFLRECGENNVHGRSKKHVVGGGNISSS